MIYNNKVYVGMVRRHCLNLSTDGWPTNSCVLLFHNLTALGKNEYLCRRG